MRSSLWGAVAISALWACGGMTLAGGSDAGGDGSGSGGGGSSSGGSSGASSGSSGGSSSGSSSSSGASSSSSGSGSSSGGVPPVDHRPDDSQCLQPAPPGDCGIGGSGGPGMCSDDSQCVDAGVNGRCVENIGGAPYCFCTTDTCADDSACPTGQTCACHGSPYMYGEGNQCLPGNCRVDADCGSGGWCSPTSSTIHCGQVGGYYCHTSQDQCVNDSDCVGPGGADICAYDTSLGYWRCTMMVFCH